MKKKILVSFCILACSHIALAQNLLWSKRTDQSQANTGLVTDKNGMVYSYGLRNNMTYTAHTSPDTLGSFLESYSTDGTVIFTKKWAMPFYIQQMEYDGNQYFYFAARFSGTQTIDGITIISQGNMDGVTGKMDLTGHILWMKTFGGGGVDPCNDVCFNSADNSVYSTGSIKDTLFLNNTFESISQQSAIILHYSATGTFINHKLYDFVPERNFGGNINSGREIIKDQSGNFFLLMDRDGQTPNSIASQPDTVVGPTMGRYVIKLDPNLDTLWTTYIIGPASYYGWSANSLRTSSNGDFYMTMESNGKYGGTAHLFRLNGSTGQIIWDYINEDGHYTDLYIDNTTIYLIGNEGADGCPCETNNGGYYVIKKFDGNNTLLGETRFSNVYLNFITKDVSGNLFVTGAFNEETVVIGQDTLMGDIDTLFSPGYARYFGRFLTKLSDINCTAPTISVSVPSYYGHYYPLCSGETATLTVNLTQGTFTWSNGTTGTQTEVDSAGFYSVMNTQPNGCKAYSLPVEIRVDGVAPEEISGDTTVCSGSINTYSITPVSGASYSWTLPSGWSGTSTSNSINATAGSTSGNVSVALQTSACGTTTKTIHVVVVSSSATLGPISGNATVCSGSTNTYSITAVSGITSYTWTLPSGWSGTSTTHSIHATSSTTGGSINVTGNGTCGTTVPRTFSVTTSGTALSMPGSISGNTTLCSGSYNTYSVTAVNGATSYTWSLPLGWTGTSVSNSITTTASTTSGNISVTANKTCGASPAQTKNISVTAIDNTVTQAGNTLSANMANANYQWIDCGNNNSIIAGATNQQFIATVSGTYAVIIMQGNCSDTSICQNAGAIGIVDQSGDNNNLTIFPNPSDNIIHISYKNNELNATIYLEITNSVGQTIYRSSILPFQGEFKKTIDLSMEQPGIYFVQIIANGQITVKKIVMN